VVCNNKVIISFHRHLKLWIFANFWVKSCNVNKATTFTERIKFVNLELSTTTTTTATAAKTTATAFVWEATIRQVEPRLNYLMHFFIGSSPQRRTIYQKKRVRSWTGLARNGVRGKTISFRVARFKSLPTYTHLLNTYYFYAISLLFSRGPCNPKCYRQAACMPTICNKVYIFLFDSDINICQINGNVTLCCPGDILLWYFYQTCNSNAIC